MKRKILFITTVLLWSSLFSGCAVNSDQIVLSNIKQGLDSCMGKLTKDKLIMMASTPTERVPVENGEIWVYKYGKSKTTTTYRRHGGLFDDEAETESKDYPYEVRLRFDKNGILVDYVSTGFYTMSNHPFKTLTCEGMQAPAASSASAPAPARAAGGYLGVKVQAVTQDMVEAAGLPKVMGAFVLIVLKNSPAERAGLKSGDIIISFDGKEIKEWQSLIQTVAATPVGKTVDIRFYRDGKEQTVQTTVGDLQKEMPKAEKEPAFNISDGVYTGTRTIANGDKYVGEFVQSKFHGKGTYTYANGDKYEGEFLNGKFTGKGMFTCMNGKPFSGTLENKAPLELTVRCN